MLFESCLSGRLHHVPRRPHDRERTNLIKSGSVFIYEENASGIKRWTDGVAWSPSRILGNFLIYRELEKPFPPGEKKRAMKRKRSSQIDADGNVREIEIEDENSIVHMPPTPPSPRPIAEANASPAINENDREMDRQLIGSLVDSYGFRPDGLVKKTMSVTLNGVSHHLVSYYKVEDVKNAVLRRPSDDPRLHGISVRPDLYLKQNFRTPVEESEHYVVNPSNMHAHPGMPYNAFGAAGYGLRPAPYMAPHGYSMYGAPTSSPAMYGGTPAPAQTWQTASHPQHHSQQHPQHHPQQHPAPLPTYTPQHTGLPAPSYYAPPHSAAPERNDYYTQGHHLPTDRRYY